MSDRLADLLAHPLRHRVLREYQAEPACPSDVARRLDEPLNLVSYHTRVLAAHGGLELVRTGRRHGALVRYYRALVPERIEDDDWSTLDAGRRRQLVLHALALANREARRAGLRNGFDGPSWHLSRSPLELDEQAVVAASQLLRRTLDDVARIAKEAHDRAGERQPYLVVLLGFSSRPTAQESDA